jgi:transposase
MYLVFERWRVNCPRCGGVHVEHLDWLAQNPRYTQRFALHAGKLCRDIPNKAVAEMECLHHSTVKGLDKLYMQQQVTRAGMPASRAIGIDEISIRKGHNYCHCQRSGAGSSHLSWRRGPQEGRPRPIPYGSGVEK